MKKFFLKTKNIVTFVLVVNFLFTFSNVQAASDWNDWNTGYATYTGSGYEGGNALLDPIPSDMEITALNTEDYNKYGVNASLAGAYLKVEGPKGSTVVYVTDRYPEGAKGALDLCPTSFEKIGDKSLGKIDIKWQVVKAPISGNFKYRMKEGTSQWWAAIQVRNHKYPVLKMEYNKDGKWTNMEKTLYNHFLGDNMGTKPLKIRITDITGQVVEDTLPALPENSASSAYIKEGNVQFPDTGKINEVKDETSDTSNNNKVEDETSDTSNNNVEDETSDTSNNNIVEDETSDTSNNNIVEDESSNTNNNDKVKDEASDTSNNDKCNVNKYKYFFSFFEKLFKK